jgi:DNA-directed RNA polymerase subunit RPC12/RpoP
MPKKENIRTCIDCGKNISNLHHNAIRCRACSKKRKKQQDQKRHKEKHLKQIKWNNFIEDDNGNGITHRNAKGSKLRYWLDKICKILTIEELEFLLILWYWRSYVTANKSYQRREYRTCAGMVRDWRDYFVVNKFFNEVSFDAETGIIFNTDGSYLTVDFDEDNENYIIRNSEGTIICRY